MIRDLPESELERASDPLMTPGTGKDDETSENILKLIINHHP